MANEKLIKVGGAEVAQSEIEKALALLERQKEQRAKQADKVKNNPELKAKADERARRLRAKNTILCRKAVAAGITVSEAEVDAYIAENAAA